MREILWFHRLEASYLNDLVRGLGGEGHTVVPLWIEQLHSLPHPYFTTTCRGHSALTGIRVQRTKVDSKVKLRVWKYIVWILWGMISCCKIINLTTSVSERCDGRREKDTGREGGRELKGRGEGRNRDGWGITFTWILHLPCSKHVGEFPFPLFSTTHTLENPQL